MSTFARIANGVVAELFTPPAGVPITDCFNPGLTWIECDGTPSVAPGWTYSGSAFAAPVIAAPTAQQVAEAAYASLIAEGLTITSAGTPALNGIYAIDAESQGDIATEAQFISTFSEFTTGATSNLPWPLANGSFVTFPTTAEFLAFAKVAAQTVAAAKLALAQSAAMPSAAVAIP